MPHANEDSTQSPGTLYIVATPIGNLEDFTFRAVRILKEVDLIVAEDSRRSRTLLNHYDISTPFGPSIYEGVDERKVDQLLNELVSGKSIALISDAGTPLIQDPGFPLVRDAVNVGVPVVAIPGPTALITALATSGLPTDHFIFDGVPSKKDGRRRAYFESLIDETRTVVIYESPHRIIKTLKTVAEVLPERRLVLCRELTKVHEEILRGVAEDLLSDLEARPSIKGEFALVIDGKPKRK